MYTPGTANRGLSRACSAVRPEGSSAYGWFSALNSDGQRGILVQVVAELHAQIVALGRTVLAVAVRAEMRAVHDVVEVAERAAGVQPMRDAAVAAHERGRTERRPWRPILGENLDHAAGGIAVQRGKRAAQHLDALGGGQVEVVGLARSA